MSMTMNAAPRPALGSPALSVTGVTKAHGLRAVKWLASRSLCSWYRQDDHSLNAFEFKHGAEWTDNALREALKETRNGANYLPVRR